MMRLNPESSMLACPYFDCILQIPNAGEGEMVCADWVETTGAE
jgi:hypothetical protein